MILQRASLLWSFAGFLSAHRHWRFDASLHAFCIEKTCNNNAEAKPKKKQKTKELQRKRHKLEQNTGKFVTQLALRQIAEYQRFDREHQLSIASRDQSKERPVNSRYQKC
jgi:hypothetical protein